MLKKHLWTAELSARTLFPMMKLCLLAALLWPCCWALANPEPDLPIRLKPASGAAPAQLIIEVDPRCFTTDPMHERYLMKVDLQAQSADYLKTLQQQAINKLGQWLSFQLDGAKEALKPTFQTSFTGIDHAPLVKADDPAVIQCLWSLPKDIQAAALRLTVTPACPYAVILHPPLAKDELTLFPKETSPVLVLKRL
jgi:hypothetical protein